MNIIIKGIGIVSSLGIGAEATAEALRKGDTGIHTMKYLQSQHTELPVGEVPLSNEEMIQMLNATSGRYVSRTALMGAIALREALHSAGIDADLKGKRVCLISGTTVGGMDMTERVFASADDNDLYYCVKHHDCGSSTEDMARLAGVEAECCTVSTACSAALNAIIVGSEMLKNDEADIVIAGGSEALSRFHLNGFNSLKILDDKPSRPFCATRQGLNLGEGAAYVVMTREEDAKGKGIYLAGYANRCDAYHQTASSPEGKGASLAMSAALRMAHLTPQDIDYVNAHGTGTPDNDRSESHALQTVFGENLPPVSSTKGATGHTTSASGAIETVICILAMRNGFIPGNNGWREKDDECIAPVAAAYAATLHHVMCNSFGFGGNDSSIILSDTTVEQRQDAVPSWQVEEVADVTVDSMEQLTELAEYVSPRETRRMGKLLKAATLSSLKALRMAGVDNPDAIITATANGMLENSEQLLREIADNGEQTTSPTLFMQSTHNTIGSAIAIRLGCHGYNITYTQGDKSLQCALSDARRLIATGQAETVLVGCHDESAPYLNTLLQRLGEETSREIYSRSIVLTRKKER